MGQGFSRGPVWDRKQKVWWGPYKLDQLDALVQYFRGKVWLDHSGLKKPLISEHLPALPQLDDRILNEIKAFEDWMRNKRYSESTIKTYTGGLFLFFRFLGNPQPESITNEDLEKFNKDYIIARKYSISFQSQRTDLRYIQEILGHNSSKTTEIYMHVSRKKITKIRSPFDDLQARG